MPRQLDVYIYHSVAADLRTHIESGELKPGDRLPPETALQARYGIARGTAAHAVRVLREEGLVELRRGHGTFVRRPHARTQLVELRARDRAHARMPTRAERHEHQQPDGVPVLVVTRINGSVEVYPGDVAELVAHP